MGEGDCKNLNVKITRRKNARVGVISSCQGDVFTIGALKEG